MIYVPESSTYNKCYVVQNENVIRAYDSVPVNGGIYSYRDYYIHSDYIFRDGFGQWSSYATLPVCLSSSDITNDYFYRVDLSSIMIIFATMFLFIVYFPVKIFSRVFGRWLKL